jgi:hypothetical protein
MNTLVIRIFVLLTTALFWLSRLLISRVDIRVWVMLALLMVQIVIVYALAKRLGRSKIWALSCIAFLPPLVLVFLAPKKDQTNSASTLREVKPHPEEKLSPPQGWRPAPWWLFIPVIVILAVFQSLGANFGFVLVGALSLTMGFWGLLSYRTADPVKLKKYIGTDKPGLVVLACVLGVLIGVVFLSLSFLSTAQR